MQPALPNALPDMYGLLVILAAGAMLPFFAVLASSYTKIVIVFALLRQALGLQQAPPNLVLNALAIVLSVFVMSPVINQSAEATRERMAGKAGWTYDNVVGAFEAATVPVKAFLGKQVKERERRFFMKAATQLWPKEQIDRMKPDDLNVLLPAFTLSELTEAFQIGFVLYIVFAVIDIVIGNILLALGMSMISPTIVSVPFKLLLFIMLDGWFRLVQGLVMSYRL
jgi:type III secretion protein R